MDTYLANNDVRMYTTITISPQLGGGAIDPVTVTLHLTLPTGAVIDISSSIVRDSVGNYHADYVPTLLGVYTYEWVGTAPAVVFDKRQFLVVDTPN
jgi:hypothetical protein